MNRTYKISFLVLGVFLIIAMAMYYQMVFKKSDASSGLNNLNLGVIKAEQTLNGDVSVPDDLTERYQSTTHPFRFQYPFGYKVNEIKGGVEGGSTVVVQDDNGNGFQIVILPFDEEGSVLTKERVMSDIPDLVISDVQEVELGLNGRGIAFKSDNEAFGGSSREVWFVFGGQLYQISTYIKNDPLLQAVLGTWEFRK